MGHIFGSDYKGFLGKTVCIYVLHSLQQSNYSFDYFHMLCIIILETIVFLKKFTIFNLL